MSYYGGGHGSFFHSEKLASFVAFVIFVLAIVELYFIIVHKASFLASNIPYITFKVNTIIYGIVLMVALFMSLIVMIGIGLKTIAVISIIALVAFSGVVYMSGEEVELTPLRNDILSTPRQILNNLSKKPEFDKRCTPEQLGDLHDRIVSSGKVYLKHGEGMNEKEVAWCSSAEGTAELKKKNPVAEANCSTRCKWKRK